MASNKTYSITNDPLTGKLPVWSATNKQFVSSPNRPNSFNGAFSSNKFEPIINRESPAKNSSTPATSAYSMPSGYSSGYSMSYNPGDYGYNLDLSAFNRARDTAIANANKSKELLKSQYDRLLGEISRQRTEGNEQFGRGRATITEDAYDRNRANLNNLASRGLAGSGLQQLGEVQERMETGNQMNDLASQYYSYMDDLNEQQKAGEEQYNQGIASIESSLEEQLANLGLQEFQAQNEYNQYMSNLALQLADMQATNAYRNISAGKASNSLDKLQKLQSGLDTYSYLINNGAYGAKGSDDYEYALTDFANNILAYGTAGGDVTPYMSLYNKPTKAQSDNFLATANSPILPTAAAIARNGIINNRHSGSTNSSRPNYVPSAYDQLYKNMLPAQHSSKTK